MEIPHDFVPVLVAQIGLFLVLWVVLKRFWFDPALRIIAARERRSHGALAEARAAQDEATRLRREHAEALEQVKGEAQREMQELVRQAETEQRRLIAEANEDAQRTMEATRTVVATEVAAARRTLQSETLTIAREVAKAVMGRAV